jgi:hypothetical protein
LKIQIVPKEYGLWCNDVSFRGAFSPVRFYHPVIFQVVQQISAAERISPIGKLRVMGTVAAFFLPGVILDIPIAYLQVSVMKRSTLAKKSSHIRKFIFSSLNVTEMKKN